MDEKKDNDRIRYSRTSTSRLLAAFLAFLIVACLGMMLWWSGRNISQKPLSPTPRPSQQDNSVIITRKVEAINGVEGADVIVLNRTALIALDLRTGITPQETKAIKGEAANTAKGMEDVDEVLVTAHPDLVAEVKAILKGEAPLERLESIYEKIRDQRL